MAYRSTMSLSGLLSIDSMGCIQSNMMKWTSHGRFSLMEDEISAMTVWNNLSYQSQL